MLGSSRGGAGMSEQALRLENMVPMQQFNGSKIIEIFG
jgi:hypothetical protein